MQNASGGLESWGRMEVLVGWLVGVLESVTKKRLNNFG